MDLLGCGLSGGFPECSVDNVNDVVQQGNGCSFGVCTCMFALLLYVDQTLSFYQQLINGKECRNCIELSIFREGLCNIFKWIYYMNMYKYINSKCMY